VVILITWPQVFENFGLLSADRLCGYIKFLRSRSDLSSSTTTAAFFCPKTSETHRCLEFGPGTDNTENRSVADHVFCSSRTAVAGLYVPERFWTQNLGFMSLWQPPSLTQTTKHHQSCSSPHTLKRFTTTKTMNQYSPRVSSWPRLASRACYQIPRYQQ
jgi:hypothetical protein